MLKMIDFRSITPTIFFINDCSGLKQLMRFEIFNDGELTEAVFGVSIPGMQEQKLALTVCSGLSEHEVYIPEIKHRCVAGFTIEADGRQCASRDMDLQVQRKWVVHVLQMSHHDPGYTDLPSLVLREHDEFLDEAIDISEHTESFPDDAKFRIVI